jgi:hypothetical protein
VVQRALKGTFRAVVRNDNLHSGGTKKKLSLRSSVSDTQFLKLQEPDEDTLD